MKVIVNADDFGMEDKVNDAIIYLINIGLIDRCSLMVNMPHCTELIDSIKEYNGFLEKIVLHLNLTQGRPLTGEIRNTIFCNEEGMMVSDNISLMNRLYIDKKTDNAIKIEVDAQMKRFIEIGLPSRHFDSHNYSSGDYSLRKTVTRVAEENGFTSIRLAKNIYSRENKGIKFLYRQIVNMRLTRFNEAHKSEQASQLFGSLYDVQQCLGKYTNKDIIIELMVHPIVDKNGEIVDHYTGEHLIKPLAYIKANYNNQA